MSNKIGGCRHGEKSLCEKCDGDEQKLLLRLENGDEQKLLLRLERLAPNNVTYITLAQHR